MFRFKVLAKKAFFLSENAQIRKLSKYPLFGFDFMQGI